mgnify:CR=1 FL=1
MLWSEKYRGFQKKSARNGRKKLWNWLVFRKNYIYSLRLSFPEDRREGRRSREFLPCAPKVLVLDEPTAGLDPRGRDEILDQISRLHRERHMTIILVSHSMEDVARYADRLLVMNHGKKVFDGTPREVFSHYKELEAMGLAAPQVTYLVHDLKAQGIAIDESITTVEEAREAILTLWRNQTKEGTGKC